MPEWLCSGGQAPVEMSAALGVNAGISPFEEEAKSSANQKPDLLVMSKGMPPTPTEEITLQVFLKCALALIPLHSLHSQRTWHQPFQLQHSNAQSVCKLMHIQQPPGNKHD